MTHSEQMGKETLEDEAMTGCTRFAEFTSGAQSHLP